MNKDNEEQIWWRGTSVYQIYPRSYKDTNNDGIGDLGGIISKLDYIKEAGFETIWISPFFKSPQRDFGYDVSDYYKPAEEYGTLEEVEKLIKEVHSRKMFIIFDMVLNHTSDEHPWFKESSSSINNPKKDWYVWKDAKNSEDIKNGKSKKPIPPNNWKSQVSGSGWHWNEKRQQFYWAAFLPFQPDLNYRNPEVKEAMFSMLEFWLKKSVDGFRLDIIGSIFEDKQFRDSPFIWKLFPDENNEGMLFRSKCRTENLPESFQFAKDLRKVTDNFSEPPRFMVGETFGSPETISNFCKNKGLHSAFAFKCTSVPFTASSFKDLLTEYEHHFPYPLTPVWAFTNHDRTRRMSALGENPSKAKLNAFFQLTARGIPFFYFGEEIGMTDTKLSHKNSLDPVSFPFKTLPEPIFNLINKKIHGSVNRDCVRTPMQWDKSENAGFCKENITPWLPINKNYKKVNTENTVKDTDSIFNCIKRINNYRAKSDILRFGQIKLINDSELPKNILGYNRTFNKESLTILLNFSSSESIVKNEHLKNYSLEASTKCKSNAIENDKLALSPFEGIIITEKKLSH
ncbi:MAG: alpha-amylase family glycosyl hydrolase [Spirochaetales bacterium]|nr:alpha-amylase family glycosyl hydrolase [Spirochaetales bacterium]